MDEETLYYHAVATALHGDYHALKKVSWHGSWKKAYQLLLMGTSPVPTLEDAHASLASNAIRLVLKDGPHYPPALKEISDAPFGLYVRGSIEALFAARISAIAIVGTRRATPDGIRLARRFGRELARAGIVIVSGLAIGIDAGAHQGALEIDGVSIAVLANGIDHIYPHTNTRLGENILSHGGAIVSEYPPGELSRKWRFIERNRIISGLAQGALVIEAPASSGSLATASFALEQNRDVFVVPGNIAHPNFRGANDLIRQGATLVTKPEDILEAYGISLSAKKEGKPIGGTREETLILQALRDTPGAPDVDKISQATKLEPRIVNRAITFLILKHVIKESEGGYILETN